MAEENLSDIELRRRDVIEKFANNNLTDPEDIDFFLTQYLKGEIVCEGEGDKEKLQKIVKESSQTKTKSLADTFIKESMTSVVSAAPGTSPILQNNYSQFDSIVAEIKKLKEMTGTDDLIAEANIAVLDQNLNDRTKDPNEIVKKLYEARNSATRNQRNQIDKALKELNPKYWSMKKDHASAWDPRKWSGYYAMRASIQDIWGSKNKRRTEKFEAQFEHVKKAIELRQEYAKTKWLSKKFFHKAAMKARMTFSSPTRKFSKLVSLADEAGLNKITNEIIAPTENQKTSSVFTKAEKAYNDKTKALMGLLKSKIDERQKAIKDLYTAEKSRIKSTNPNANKILELQAKFAKNLENRTQHSNQALEEVLKDTPAFKVAKKLGIENELLNKVITEDRIMTEILKNMPGTQQDKQKLLEAMGLNMTIDENGVVSKNEKKPEEEEKNGENDNKIEPLIKKLPEEERSSFKPDRDEAGNDLPYRYDEASNMFILKPDKLTEGSKEDIKKILDLAQDGKLTLIAADFDTEELVLIQKVAQELAEQDGKYKNLSIIAQSEGGSKKELGEFIKEKQEEEKKKKEAEAALNEEKSNVEAGAVIGEELENSDLSGNQSKSPIDRLKELSGRGDSLGNFAKDAMDGSIKATDEVSKEIKESSDFKDLNAINTFKAMEKYIDDAEKSDPEKGDPEKGNAKKGDAKKDDPEKGDAKKDDSEEKKILTEKDQIELHEEMHKEVKKVSDIEVKELPSKEDLAKMQDYEREAMVALYDLNKTKEKYTEDKAGKKLSETEELAFMQKKTRILSAFISHKTQPSENKTINIGNEKLKLSQIRESESSER